MGLFKNKNKPTEQPQKAEPQQSKLPQEALEEMEEAFAFAVRS